METMSWCGENVPLWRVAIIFVLGLSGVYVYLYTSAFDGVRTSSVIRVMEGDLQVWSNKVGSISYYLQLVKNSEKNLDLAMFANVSATLETSTKPDNSTSVPSLGTTESVPTPAQRLEALKKAILTNKSNPLMVLFTTWSYSAEKELVHNLTTINWISFRPFVIPVIFTNETNVANECRKRGWEVFPVLKTAANGIPVLKFMYRDVMKAFNATFYTYSNGDILFTNGMLETLVSLLDSSVNISKPTLMVGKRTNVDNVTMEEGSSWEGIEKIGKKRGKLFTGYAEDFFITSRTYPWPEMAEVVIGRRAYDNFLVYYARLKKYNVIDVTKTVLAVHQTTKAGNFEGHHHENRDYNDQLLVKLYKRVKYNTGIVECIEGFTQKNGPYIAYKSRIVGKYCKV